MMDTVPLSSNSGLFKPIIACMHLSLRRILTARKLLFGNSNSLLEISDLVIKLIREKFLQVYSVCIMFLVRHSLRIQNDYLLTHTQTDLKKHFDRTLPEVYANVRCSRACSRGNVRVSDTKKGLLASNLFQVSGLNLGILPIGMYTAYVDNFPSVMTLRYADQGIRLCRNVQSVDAGGTRKVTFENNDIEFPWQSL